MITYYYTHSHDYILLYQERICAPDYTHSHDYILLYSQTQLRFANLTTKYISDDLNKVISIAIVCTLV